MRLQPRIPRPRSIAAVIMSLGLGGVATLALVTDASAHANHVSGAAVCTNGTYSITWTVQNDWNLVDHVTLVSHTGGGTVSGLPETIAASGDGSGLAGVQPFKTNTFTQTGILGTATSASVTIKGTWSDKATSTDSNSVTLAGNCATGGVMPISAKALTDHECNSTEWHFVITDVDTKTDAPTSIHVTWADNATADVALADFNGKTASYLTTLHLDEAVTSATATIYASWSGQFNLSHGPCISTPTSSVTPTGSSTSSTSVSASVTATSTSTSSTSVSASVTATSTSTSSTSVSASVTATSSGGGGGGSVSAGTSAPLLVQGVCTAGTMAPPVISIPGITGVSYHNGATVLAPGDHPIPFGASYTVTAAAEAGFTLVGGSVTSWTFTPNASTPCGVTPTVLGVTFVGGPPATTPVAVLPFTGLPLLPTVALGFGLLLAGALLFGSSRRHRVTRGIPATARGGSHRL